MIKQVGIGFRVSDFDAVEHLFGLRQVDDPICDQRALNEPDPTVQSRGRPIFRMLFDSFAHPFKVLSAKRFWPVHVGVTETAGIKFEHGERSISRATAERAHQALLDLEQEREDHQLALTIGRKVLSVIR